jgi:hypothetical protein
MRPLLDERGEPYTEVLDYDGYLFPNMLKGGLQDMGIAEHLVSLDKLGFEGDEICVVSYPRSGMINSQLVC